MEKKFHHRLPRIVERPDGLAQVTEGFRALSLRDTPLDGEIKHDEDEDFNIKHTIDTHGKIGIEEIKYSKED